MLYLGSSGVTMGKVQVNKIKTSKVLERGEKCT